MHVKYVTAESIEIKGVLECVSPNGNSRPGERVVHSPIMYMQYMQTYNRLRLNCKKTATKHCKQAKPAL